jgi:hypothetical protein
MDKHPSGLTWERWNWPFKTPEERELVREYFALTSVENLEELEPSPF